MLIFNKRQEETKEKKSWSNELKDILIQKNHKFIDKHIKERPPLPDIPIESIFPDKTSLKEHHNYTIKKGIHTTFSQYIPIIQNKYHKNELTDYFSYLFHLEETDRNQYENEVCFISEKIVDNMCFGQWREISRRYLTGLNLEGTFHYHYLLVTRGTQVLEQLRSLSNPSCLIGAFFLKLMEIQTFLNSETEPRKCMATTIQLADDITLENLTKTNKYLFCSICLIYDCPRHELPFNVLENNCQYMPPRETSAKLQQKKVSALKLIAKMVNFYDERGLMEEQDDICGDKCYKKLDKINWHDQIHHKSRNYSYFFQTMMKMGIEIFNFDPCQIKILFNNISLINAGKNTNKKSSESIQCQEIFYYFIKHYNLLQKFHFKFKESEQTYLSNERLSLYDIKIANKKVLQRKTKETSSKQEENHYKSLCYHHFLGKDAVDETCLNCICSVRGYCLPDCLCSHEYCQIKMKGCFCSRQSTCWENKCICFKNMRVCTPETCSNCVIAGQKSCCLNNQEFLSIQKSTKIGFSSIPNAGLGLFADQFITKGEFIIRYVGQVVTSSNLEKLRENLVLNNLFYNFKLNANSSIDSRLYGNKSRFINHSKKASNSVPRKFSIREEEIIIFYALKNIYQGEEILFNYNGEGSLDEFTDKYPFIDS